MRAIYILQAGEHRCLRWGRVGDGQERSLWKDTLPTPEPSGWRSIQEEPPAPGSWASCCCPVYPRSAERMGPSENAPADTCPVGPGQGLQQGFWKQDLTCYYTLCSLGSPGGDPQSCSPASVH